ncbi:hypothetical protein SKAU_G00068260 [Synaphobranchus kaupii]|uniref:Uncharacterized protein n=1 Tax=Synaphobranchus kaupii TaxID=118154 RepID=A0A9Q1JAA4_SYNKA|nr:hypothetical protein SKAU_G00068260 [Synaphobranchus kaupii]
MLRHRGRRSVAALLITASRGRSERPAIRAPVTERAARDTLGADRVPAERAISVELCSAWGLFARAKARSALPLCVPLTKTRLGEDDRHAGPRRAPSRAPRQMGQLSTRPRTRRITGQGECTCLCGFVQTPQRQVPDPQVTCRQMGYSSPTSICAMGRACAQM